MENKILLSIAIPTYNRENELKLCLESIMNQIDGCEDLIEIIISDNASTDNTKFVINKIFSTNNAVKFKYNCNCKNRGPDFNILQCISLASGQYIQMLSDDDILLPGAIRYILSIIINEAPNYIYLNFGFLDKYRIRRKDYMNGLKAQFNERNVQKYYDKNMFLEYVGIYITTLSTVIYRSKLVKSIPNKDKLIGSRFIQSHLALLSLSNVNEIFFANKCCVIIRDGNSGGFNFFDVWIRNYKKLILQTAVKAGFSRRTCKKVFKRTCKKEICIMIRCARNDNSSFNLNNRGVVVQGTWMYPTLWKYLYISTFLPIDLVEIIQKN